MSAVEELRAAARLMRERAEATLPAVENEGWWTRDGMADLMLDSMCAIQGYRQDAAYIASWHPEVALAVADWLDSEADEIPPLATHYRDGLISEAPAVKVARTYLGTGGEGQEGAQDGRSGDLRGGDLENVRGHVGEGGSASEAQNGDDA